MDKVQVSRAVQSLLAARRLTRVVDDADGRVTQLSLSARGLAIYNELVPVALQLERDFLSILSADDRAALDRLLTKLSAGLAEAGLARAREQD
jgi:DNA-binding MarR family transcriptional regulator